MLPNEMTFSNAMHIAGANDKMNIVDFSFDPETRYTFWSGITGGFFFLMLSYFGTDQSQVGRYLSGKSDRESQMGLIMNGFLKSTDAVFYSTYWSNGFCIFSIQ
jgi:SSS family solute:Na+ symporter